MNEQNRKRFEGLASRRPGHLTPDEVAWLIALVRSLEVEVEGIRLAAGEEAARLICLSCRHDLPIEMLDQLMFHIMKNGQKQACQAQTILAHFKEKP